MKISSTNAIVADTAMRCSRWAKYFTGKTELQLHNLATDDDFFRPRWRTISWTVWTVWNFCENSLKS